jgi:hypothetical protein
VLELGGKPFSGQQTLHQVQVALAVLGAQVASAKVFGQRHAIRLLLGQNGFDHLLGCLVADLAAFVAQGQRE